MTSTLISPPKLDPILFDTREWPIVYCRFPELNEPNRVSRLLDSLDLILASQQSFVMVWTPASHDHDDETHEDEKRSALWIKQRKHALRAFCAGYVYLAENESLRALLEDRLLMVKKLYGFPMRVVSNKADAQRHAQVLFDLKAEENNAK